MYLMKLINAIEISRPNYPVYRMEGDIQYLLLVDFHHKLGPKVEYMYPPGPNLAKSSPMGPGEGTACD